MRNKIISGGVRAGKHAINEGKRANRSFLRERGQISERGKKGKYPNKGGR